MITLAKKFIHLIKPNSNEVEDSYYLDKPELEEFITVYHPNCQRKSFEGIVTRLNGNEGVINNEIYFNTDCFSSFVPHDKMIGLKVQGRAKRASENDAWRAFELMEDFEDWESFCNNNNDSFEIESHYKPTTAVRISENDSNVIVDQVEFVQQEIGYLTKTGIGIRNDLCSFKLMKGKHN